MLFHNGLEGVCTEQDPCPRSAVVSDRLKWILSWARVVEFLSCAQVAEFLADLADLAALAALAALADLAAVRVR